MLQATIPSPAQQVSSAEGTLHSYAFMYGQEIFSLTPVQAREKARECREKSKQLDSLSSLNALCKCIHFESIADCLQVLEIHRE